MYTFVRENVCTCMFNVCTCTLSMCYTCTCSIYFQCKRLQDYTCGAWPWWMLECSWMAQSQNKDNFHQQPIVPANLLDAASLLEAFQSSTIYTLQQSPHPSPQTPHFTLGHTVANVLALVVHLRFVPLKL